MEKSLKRNKSIRKGETVFVIAGNARGKTGTVLAYSGDKVLVQGLNVRKKHVKRTQQSPNGGIVEREMPIHVSNVKPYIADASNKK
jgi:large subunit ribosomal protein L24